MYDTILVATDGSESSNRAVDQAFDLTSTFDAALHAIYVIDTRRYGRSTLREFDTVLENLEEQGTEVLQDLTDRSDVEVSTEIRHGRPSDEIDAYADEIDADLVVLGKRGLADTDAGTTIGSVAERVVRSAGRPVITA